MRSTSFSSVEKLNILGGAAQYDLSCACGDSGHRVKADFTRWIYPAVIPSGGQIRMLKILLTNQCKNNCRYCENRVSSNIERVSFEPGELAELFMALCRKRMVNALFLSSAVMKSADHTMGRMIQTIELLRYNYHFRGYIHLKILPGASYSMIERSVHIATRVSVNLECPNSRALAKIAPEKNLERDLLAPMQWIHDLSRQDHARNADQTTQFMVGAVDESDREILGMVSSLYKNLKVSRSYFSAYQPPLDEAWTAISPGPMIREHRLYQADFLLRKYGFAFDEFDFSNTGNLSLETDPKTRWAEQHGEFFPLDVAIAAYQELLRVPGIGPTIAKRIIDNRRHTVIRDSRDLAKLGIHIAKTLPYIILRGRRLAFPGEPAASQLAFEL
jgi:putative DNA modification/repair radical SAM protein